MSTHTLVVVLSSGPHDILKYMAQSLADAETYERDTLLSLADSGMPIVIDIAIKCSGCRADCPFRHLTLKSPLAPGGRTKSRSTNAPRKLTA